MTDFGTTSSLQNWLLVKQCPLCGSQQKVTEVQLSSRHYVFNKEKIAFPSEGISVCLCAECGLIYKTVLPTPLMLSDTFTKHAGHIWNTAYDFADEVALMKRMFLTGFDLLDIGPSNGGFLKACSGIQGRRSGLDVVKLPGLDEWLRGEFIQGLVEDDTLKWSGKPYDVVTLFDVMEHLYRPAVAFSNLSCLTKSDGMVVIETGAADSFMPKNWGIKEWWYVNLFEHHVFWTPASLAYAAKQAGFEVISVKHKRHKQLSHLPPSDQALGTLKLTAYSLSPLAYKQLLLQMGKPVFQPWNPMSRDHMLVVLKRR